MGAASHVFLARIFENTLTRYTTALAAILVALLIRGVLSPFLGDYAPFVTLFPAVALAAWFCGIGASILSVVVALLAARFWFVQPAHSLSVPDTPQLVGIVVFLFASAVIVAMGEVNRRNNEVLRGAQDELETRVEQRTAELDKANQSLRDLTARLLHFQDEERRRLARELHDSVGQTLAALSMNLSSVGADIRRLTKTAAAVEDSEGLVKEMTAGIRTISYLLHPPLLDEAGLTSALRWYVEGLTARSEIGVDLEVPDNFGRLPKELETAIFRVVQECLTNVHRHSGSPIAEIRLSRSADDVQLEVRDKGKGIPPEKLSEMASTGAPGVGIRGMRERIHQLGGSLEISSAGSGKGTAVVVTLPIVNLAPPIDAPFIAFRNSMPPVPPTPDPTIPPPPPQPELPPEEPPYPDAPTPTPGLPPFPPQDPTEPEPQPT
jgi:signal transduction histidine kinase